MTRRSGSLALVIAFVAASCSSSGSTTSEDPAAATSTAEAAPDSDSPVSTAPLSTEGELGESGSRAVILDYSPTVSDVGALLYLLTHPDVDLLAVALPTTGEAGCDLGVDVTLGILDMLGKSGVPVACGSAVPDGAEPWPGEFLAGHASLASGLSFTGKGGDARSASQLIADVVAGSARPVTLVAVAPLTNVAEVIESRPEVASGLDRLVIMGGAVDTAGNVFDSDAEWNLWIDVPSAVQVLESNIPITFVPLDATNHVPVPELWQLDLDNAEQSPAIAYLAGLVGIFPAVTSGFYYLWDELAASVAAGDEVVSTELMNLMVSEEAGASYGSIVEDPSGRSVEVAVGVSDPDAFYDKFLSTLAGVRVSRTADATPIAPDDIPTSVDGESPPGAVLAYWMDNALRGEVAAAGEVVAPGAPWTGLGASADAFVEGSAPYEVVITSIACTTNGDVASCRTDWTDRWIDANPELESGSVSVRAEVVDGFIVTFESVSFGGAVEAAFNAHFAWLGAEQPDSFREACAADSASKECSQLLVDTVDDWVASR